MALLTFEILILLKNPLGS